MRALGVAAVALLLLAGCSIFFDPTKATVGCTAAACPARANAVARCEGGKCAYSCTLGRIDSDGDLNAASGSTSTGCEACAPAATPAELHAVVGNPSGGVHWEWAQPSGLTDGGTSNPLGFKLCTGATAGSVTSCQTLDASVACTMGECGALTLGHTNDVRVHARLQAIDACGVTTSGGPTRSTTPIDGTLRTAKQSSGMGDNGCDAGFSVIDGGALRIDQQSALLCISAATFGDDEWEDFTLTGEIRFPNNRPTPGGFAFHYPTPVAQKSRSSMLLVPDTTESEYTAGMTTIPPQQSADKVVATATPKVPLNQWVAVEIVSKGGEVATSVGAPGAQLKPALRWYESAPGQRGRFGVFILTVLAGQLEWVEFQNVQISTRAELPPRGPSTLKPVFQGSTIPTEGRVIPANPPGGSIAMINCPMNLAEGAGCTPAGSCKPLTTSSCLYINQPGLTRRSVTFDQPLGLDPRQPWRLSFKFLAMTPNDSFAPILRTQVGAQVLRGPMGMWPGPMAVFGVPSDGTIEPLKWNKIELKFTGTQYESFLNGKKLNVGGVYPPAGWEAHLGAISFGGPEGPIPVFGQGNVQGQWTELEIVQPP